MAQDESTALVSKWLCNEAKHSELENRLEYVIRLLQALKNYNVLSPFYNPDDCDEPGLQETAARLRNLLELQCKCEPDRPSTADRHEHDQRLIRELQEGIGNIRKILNVIELDQPKYKMPPPSLPPSLEIVNQWISPDPKAGSYMIPLAPVANAQLERYVRSQALPKTSPTVTMKAPPQGPPPPARPPPPIVPPPYDIPMKQPPIGKAEPPMYKYPPWAERTNPEVTNPGDYIAALAKSMTVQNILVNEKMDSLLEKINACTDERGRGPGFTEAEVLRIQNTQGFPTPPPIQSPPPKHPPSMPPGLVPGAASSSGALRHQSSCSAGALRHQSSCSAGALRHLRSRGSTSR